MISTTFGRSARAAWAAAPIRTRSEKAGSARAQLASTPRYVDVPVHADYQFDRARIAATRTMTVHYYVIDRGAGTYFKSTFDVVEEQQFRVSYNVHEKDPDRASHLAQAQTEDDLARWEDAPMVVKLSQLVDHYLKNDDRTRHDSLRLSLRAKPMRRRLGRVVVAVIRSLRPSGAIGTASGG